MHVSATLITSSSLILIDKSCCGCVSEMFLLSVDRNTAMFQDFNVRLEMCLGDRRFYEAIRTSEAR